MKNKIKQLSLSDEIIKLFQADLISVITHPRSLLEKAQISSKTLLLIFNNKFTFSTFSTIINTNKELSKLIAQNMPLIFTEEEIINSCDIFPIEFYEILATGEVLYGKKLNDLVDIKNTNLRLQIESNLRRNIILLRQEYFIRKKELPLLLKESLNNVLLSLNNLLRLQDNYTQELNPRQILLKATEFLSINVESFFVIIRELESPINKNKKDIINWNGLFHNYLNELASIVREVDALEV